MSFEAPPPTAGTYQNVVVKMDSHFARCVMELFLQIRPKRIIETGTFFGTGTTAVIALTLKQLGITDAEFFSIEVNPHYHAAAVKNLATMGLQVTLLNGLSIPRNLLPTVEQIRAQLSDPALHGKFIDYRPEEMGNYVIETNFPTVADDLLGQCLRHFDYQPDFLLLDSGGHLGNVEFNYVLPQIKGHCFFALDDTNHLKHYKTVIQMKQDRRFRILIESNEKFGFCFAEFTP